MCEIKLNISTPPEICGPLDFELAILAIRQIPPSIIDANNTKRQFSLLILISFKRGQEL